MELTLHAYGIARDILGGSVITLNLQEHLRVNELHRFLLQEYPELAKLKSLRIAVNEEYAADDVVISAQDEVVLIPPVSGG